MKDVEYYEYDGFDKKVAFAAVAILSVGILGGATWGIATLILWLTSR